MKKVLAFLKQLNHKILSAVKPMLYKNRYLWNRIGVAIFTLFLTTLIIFVILRLIPGNVVDDFAIRLVNERRVTFEEAKKLAVEILGYDPEQSPFVQFFGYMGNLLKGNLGQSMSNPLLSVNDVIKKNLPWTLFVSTISLTISYLIGIVLGSKSAWGKSKIKKHIINGYTIVGGSIPDFILGLLLLYVFAFVFPIFPVQGAYNAFTSQPGFNLRFLLDVLYHAALPILAYSIIQVANWTLMMRASCISVLGSDYINAARTRGIPDRIIINRYLRKNAILPLITSLAISFAMLFGGAPLMENVFNYPGIGQQFSIAIVQKEYFMIVGILFFTSFIVILVNLIADSLYSVIDPRIRRDI